MFDSIANFLNACLRWVITNPGYCLLGILGLFVVGAIVEKIFPCLFKHNYERLIENFHDSPNVQSYTVAFQCSRCGKRY